jgi:hypothetical protein
VVMRYRPSIVRLAGTVSLLTWAAILLVTLAGGVLQMRTRRG